jgi:branched-chain amino acid transport system permease protein
LTLQEQLLQFLVSGLIVGSIYALIALGFVVIHNVTGIVNFAQGEFAVYGALVAIMAAQPVNLLSGNLQLDLGWPLPLAGVIGVAVAIGVGLLLYRVGIQPAHQASALSMIIITSQSLWVVGVTAVLLVGLYLFFNYTLTGKALRACAVNPTAARLMGINTYRMALLAFGLSAATSAIAGMVIAPVTFMTYDRGLLLSLKGFVAATMGGMSSLPGAVIGGLLLGIVEAFAAGLLSSGYKDAVAFLVLFIVLALRLGGILKGRGAEQAGL